MEEEGAGVVNSLFWESVSYNVSVFVSVSLCLCNYSCFGVYFCLYFCLCLCMCVCVSVSDLEWGEWVQLCELVLGISMIQPSSAHKM